VTIGTAALLGAVQGITEFLPISSKTHLVVVPALLGKHAPSLAFIALLHLGTFIALIVYFARDLWSFVADLPRAGSEGRRMVGLLIVATVPAAVVGFLFEKSFERLLEHPRWAAFALLATAVVLVGAEWLSGSIGGRRLARPLRSGPTAKDAIGMGLAQVAALFPGVSRSGSTMGAGLTLGLRRDAAARFSFLMAIPAIAGASILEVPKILDRGVGAPEVVGFAVSLVTGYAAVSILLRYLRRWSFLPFAAYCAVFGVLAGLALS
jgi:undecaprenyl-diphosphatase